MRLVVAVGVGGGGKGWGRGGVVGHGEKAHLLPNYSLSLFTSPMVPRTLLSYIGRISVLHLKAGVYENIIFDLS